MVTDATHPPVPAPSAKAILGARPWWALVFILAFLAGGAAIAGVVVICAAPFGVPWASAAPLLWAVAALVVGGLLCVVFVAAFTSTAIIPARRRVLAAAFPGETLWDGLINSSTKKALQSLQTPSPPAVRGSRIFILLAADAIEFWAPVGSEFVFSGSVPRGEITDAEPALVGVSTISRTAIRLAVSSSNNDATIYVDVIANPADAVFSVSIDFVKQVSDTITEWRASGGNLKK